MNIIAMTKFSGYQAITSGSRDFNTPLEIDENQTIKVLMTDGTSGSFVITGYYIEI